ncbi:MAG: hypothetical protein U1F98_00370 [Verrucomicrobiota bacterium]
MKKQPTYIAPLRAGIVLAALYAVLSLLAVPFFLVATALSARSGSSAPAIFSAGFAILLPILYGVLGFLAGVLGAAVYNLIAKLTGGLEFEVRDVAAV